MSRVKSYSAKKPYPWPDRILLGHHYTNNQCGTDNSVDQGAKLFPLCLAKWQKINGQWCFSLGVNTDQPCIWWQHLIESCRHAKRAMIFAYDLPRLWQSVGFWEMMDDGTFSIIGAGKTMGDGMGSDSDSVRQGCLVAADPPVICIGWYRGLHCTLEWVDLRNYGYSYDCRAMERSELLGSVIDSAESWLRTVIEHNLGGPRFTAASQAFEAWRTNGLPYRIVPSQDLDTLHLESSAVYGGRCEAYFRGLVTPLPEHPETPLSNEWQPEWHQICDSAYHLDITSLYPSVMLDGEFPVELMYSADEWEADRVYAVNIGTHCIGDCTLETDDPLYPIRLNGRVLYPIGKFRTVLPYPDMCEATKRGHIKCCHRIQYYRTKPIFAGVIRKLWTIRQKCLNTGESMNAMVAKQLMNGLSGKFNQREARWINKPEMLATEPFGAEWVWNTDHTAATYHRTIGWLVQELQEGPYGRYSFPAITAHIMALGRWKLHRIASELPPLSLLYTHTDSLIVTSAGLSRLHSGESVRENELGFLRIKDTWNRLELYGPNHYSADGNLVCAGLPAYNRSMGRMAWKVPVRVKLESAIMRGEPSRVVEKERDFIYRAGLQNRLPGVGGWTKPIVLNGECYDGCPGASAEGE